MASSRITRRAVVGTLLAAGALVSGRRSTVASRDRLASVLARADRVRPPRRRERAWAIGEIGRSVQGRVIERWDSAPDDPRRHVVVICGTHGDERAMADLADGFGRINLPADLHLTIVPYLNPDGWAAETRRNAREVDLNRNFSWGWTDRTFAGPRPESEPETRAAVDFLRRERPDLVVWVHQPYGYVAAIQGCPAYYADIWSDVAGVPVRRNLRQVGGGESWTAIELGVPSMLVEVGGTRRAPIAVPRHVAALEALVFAVQPT